MIHIHIYIKDRYLHAHMYIHPHINTHTHTSIEYSDCERLHSVWHGHLFFGAKRSRVGLRDIQDVSHVHGSILFGSNYEFIYSGDVCTCTYIYMCVCVYVCMYVYVYMYIHIHIHIHTI